MLKIRYVFNIFLEGGISVLDNVTQGSSCKCLQKSESFLLDYRNIINVNRFPKFWTEMPLLIFRHNAHLCLPHIWINSFDNLRIVILAFFKTVYTSPLCKGEGYLLQILLLILQGIRFMIYRQVLSCLLLCTATLGQACIEEKNLFSNEVLKAW